MTWREPPGRRYGDLVAGLLLALAFSVAAHSETVLITGANRGLGLEFAKQYAALGWRVIATHRRDQVPETLAALAGENGRVMIERMDVTDHAQIDALAAKLAGTPIDVLINNAGITGGMPKPLSQSFGTLEHADFISFIRTNALGPLKVTEAFRPHIVAGKSRKVVAISSLVGSFGASFAGLEGGYWYKASKAALNAFMVNVAADLKSEGVVVALLSPGLVRVEKLAEIQIPGMIEPAESIAGMIQVIDSLGLEDTGRFLRYDGEPQPF